MASKAPPNAFSSASAQAAALNEWKQKNAKHRETANSLQRKVKQLKNDSEAVRRTSQWLQERDCLSREQESCEAALDVLARDLGELVADADHSGRQAELRASKTLLLQQLREMGALTAVPPPHFSSERETAPADLQRIHDLRQWIAAEMTEADVAAKALRLSAASDGLVSLMADFDAVADSARNRLAQLCDTYRSSAELQHIFTCTLISIEGDAREQLEGVQRTRVTSVNEDSEEMLDTVCRIVRMGHQARQFDLSAATHAALVERVAAVFPRMSSVEVHTAVDEGLARRSAQAAAKATLADFQRAVDSLLSSCESALLAARQAEEDRIEKAEAARQRDVAQADRHARLAEKRASHEALLQQRRSAEEQRRHAAAKKADALRARQAAEFQERLRLLQVFEEQQALLRAKERELQEAHARAAEEEKAARMRHNEARVEFRRRQAEQRRDALKEQEKEVRALQLKKQQALERFFAAVDKQVGVEADPLRLLKATSSSAQTESYETLAQTTRPSIAGFSDEQIMKDPRVRLYHALLAAGLHTTPYGREVVTRGYRVPPSQMSSEGNPLRGQFS